MSDENDKSRPKGGSSSRTARGSTSKSSAKKTAKPKASKAPAKKASAPAKKTSASKKQARPKTEAAETSAPERTAAPSRRSGGPREITATRRSTPEEREARRAARLAEREAAEQEFADQDLKSGDRQMTSNVFTPADEDDARLKLDATAEDIEGGPKEEDPEAAKKVGVPFLVVGAIVITYLQGIALAAGAYLPLSSLLTEEAEDEFVAFPGRITSEAWTAGGGGAGGSEAGAAFLVLGLGLAAIAFIATATQLIRLEWRGVAMILQAAAFVPAMTFILAQDELPAGIIFVPPVMCLSALALLATPRAANAFQRKKAPRREKGQFDILKLGESVGS